MSLMFVIQRCNAIFISNLFLRPMFVELKRLCSMISVNNHKTSSHYHYHYHYHLYPLLNHIRLSSTNNSSDSDSNDIVNVIYINKEGQRHEIKGKVGDNAMYLAHSNNIDIEGACEASLACCTCHVYVDQHHYDMLPSPKEEEEDMLDLAPFLKSNSRLSCQIVLTKELNGIELTLPPATRNFYVDGHKPQPH